MKTKLSISVILGISWLVAGCSYLWPQTTAPKHKFDSAPTLHVDYHRIPDAVPKRGKFHPYGTRDYTVKNRRYRVRKSTYGYVKRGYASWYGTSFHGKLTSTQDTFNLYEMTAASPDLPLPCYAKVTNLKNGKSVIVKVNDRGPFHANRIMDLSYAAARRLDFAEQGVTYVKIEALGDHNWDYHRGRPKKHRQTNQKPRVAAKTPTIEERGVNTALAHNKVNTPAIRNKTVRVASFAKQTNAEICRTKIAKIVKYPVTTKAIGNHVVVNVGPLNYDEVTEALNQLHDAGFKPLVLTNHE